MIPLYKLERLPAGQRRRKLALLLTACERKLTGTPSPATSIDLAGNDAANNDAANNDLAGIIDPDYVLGLIRLALADDRLPGNLLPDIEALLVESRKDTTPPSLLKLCNHTRHALLAAIGTFPAEWDLLVPERNAQRSISDSSDYAVDSGAPCSRSFFPGVSVYAEDIRSPFNLGSIFRTAEAFGAEKVMISPLCVPPTHSRAQRSAMGCIDYLPWEQIPLEALSPEIPVFALETGGTPIDEFDFPLQGVVLIGSEELGLSSEALARATYGRVSIPMTGIKASLNVGVAFGILMQAWTSYLACSLSKPF